MEAYISPHTLTLFGFVLLITICVITCYRLFPWGRLLTFGQRQLKEVTRTEDAHEGFISKAEVLLAYAADHGIQVGEADRRAITAFRMLDKQSKTAETVDALIAAYINLSASVYPRTADSIIQTSLQRNRDIQKYRRMVFVLALVIIPYSISTFASSTLTKKIDQAAETGENLIQQLRDALGPNYAENRDKFNNTEIIAKVSQLATAIRTSSLCRKCNRVHPLRLDA